MSNVTLLGLAVSVVGYISVTLVVADVGNSHFSGVTDGSTLACVRMTTLASSTWDHFTGCVSQILAASITQLHTYHRV